MEIAPFSLRPTDTQNGQPGGLTQLSEDFDNFLTLLTQQLQNQDPLEPMSTEEFTRQLTQFAGVEQQIAANAKLDNLVNLQANQLLGVGLGYVGNTVEFEGNNFKFDGENPVDLRYILNETSSETRINILNDEGNTVRTIQGDLEQGSHMIQWNGTNDDGLTLPEGNYSIQVSAMNDEGAPIQTRTAVSGRVDGMDTIDGEIFLRVDNGADGVNLPIQDVFSVKRPQSETGFSSTAFSESGNNNQEENDDES